MESTATLVSRCQTKRQTSGEVSDQGRRVWVPVSGHLASGRVSGHQVSGRVWDHLALDRVLVRASDQVSVRLASGRDRQVSDPSDQHWHRLQ